MAVINHEAELARAGANVQSTWGQMGFLARRYPLGAVGFIIVFLFIFTAAFANFIAPVDPTATNAKYSLAPPSSMFWLGADFMGRDMYSRIVHGARISLAVGAGAMGLGALIGITVGLASGYLGGWFALLVQRLLDIMQSLPLLVMAIVMAASLGPSLRNTIFAIAIPLVPTVARVVRSSTLSLREQPFVEAARAVGMGELRIAVRHILPYPSWGRMLSESAAEYVRTAPWLVIFPGIAISLTVFGTNLLGDALRDILDPRQRS